jgi:SAM-dependent methyltransferase
MKEAKSAWSDYSMKEAKSAWSDYCKRTSNRPPRPFLLRALGYFDTPGFAIDLGCGAGNETLELLRRGWRVLAIDGEPDAIEHVLEVVPSKDRERLQTAVVSFEDMVLPPAEFIWAGLSLSFIHPATFDKVWANIVQAIRPGGRVACDIFGPRHAWANGQGTFLTEDDIRQRLLGLEVEHFEEGEHDTQTVDGGMMHWHAFWLIARKPEQ